MKKFQVKPRAKKLFFCQKIVAVFLSLSNSLSFAAIPAQSPVTIPGSPTDLNNIAIPETIGEIRESFRGQSDKTVVLIQDAHAIPAAQRSIQQLIEYFQKQYNVKLIALEGAKAQLDPQIFKSFPDKEALKKVFDEYRERGELTGTTAAAIFSDSAGIYQGIEDWNLYEDGVSLYLQAMQIQPSVLKKLEWIKQSLENQKAMIYPKEWLEIEAVLKGFYKNNSSLPEVLQKLSRFQKPHEGSELALLLQERKKEGVTDQGIEMEVQKIAQKAAVFLEIEATTEKGKTSIKEFNANYQAFQTSRLSPQAFALYLKKIITEYQLPVSISERLYQSIQEHMRIQEIKGTKLFEAFEHYVDNLADSLLTTSEQKKLNEQSKQLRLFERFAQLELSREDWNILKGIAGHDQFLGDNNQLLSSHFSFYKNAEEREAAFADRLKELFRKKEMTSAILVAGGFHTGGLCTRLRKEGISYKIITPAIDSIPEQTNYHAHMQGDLSWKDYFEIEDGKISLYKAFVRGTRDRLLKESRVEKSRMLKTWRDQIILDLANQNQIVKASKYTSFIDEVRKDEKAKSLNKWIVSAEQFANKLRNLKASQQLTEQNILNLLKPSAIATFETAGMDETTFLQGEKFHLEKGILVPARNDQRVVRSDVRQAIEVVYKMGFTRYLLSEVLHEDYGQLAPPDKIKITPAMKQSMELIETFEETELEKVLSLSDYSIADPRLIRDEMKAVLMGGVPANFIPVRNSQVEDFIEASNAYREKRSVSSSPAWKHTQQRENFLNLIQLAERFEKSIALIKTDDGALLYLFNPQLVVEILSENITQLPESFKDFKAMDDWTNFFQDVIARLGTSQFLLLGMPEEVNRIIAGDFPTPSLREDIRKAIAWHKRLAAEFDKIQGHMAEESRQKHVMAPKEPVYIDLKVVSPILEQRRLEDNLKNFYGSGAYQGGAGERIAKQVLTRQEGIRDLLKNLPPLVNLNHISSKTRRAYRDAMRKMAGSVWGSNAEYSEQELVDLMNRIILSEEGIFIGADEFKLTVYDQRGKNDGEYPEKRFSLLINTEKKEVMILDHAGNMIHLKLSPDFNLLGTRLKQVKVVTDGGEKYLFSYIVEKGLVPPELTREEIESQYFIPEIQFRNEVQNGKIVFVPVELGIREYRFMIERDGSTHWNNLVGLTEEQTLAREYGGIEDLSIAGGRERIFSMGHSHPPTKGVALLAERVAFHQGDIHFYLTVSGAFLGRRIADRRVETIKTKEKWLMRFFIPKNNVDPKRYNDKKYMQEMESHIGDYFEIIEVPLEIKPPWYSPLWAAITSWPIFRLFLNQKTGDHPILSAIAASGLNGIFGAEREAAVQEKEEKPNSARSEMRALHQIQMEEIADTALFQKEIQSQVADLQSLSAQIHQQLKEYQSWFDTNAPEKIPSRSSSFELKEIGKRASFNPREIQLQLDRTRSILAEIEKRYPLEVNPVELWKMMRKLKSESDIFYHYKRLLGHYQKQAALLEDMPLVISQLFINFSWLRERGYDEKSLLDLITGYFYTYNFDAGVYTGGGTVFRMVPIFDSAWEARDLLNYFFSDIAKKEESGALLLDRLSLYLESVSSNYQAIKDTLNKAIRMPYPKMDEADDEENKTKILTHLLGREYVNLNPGRALAYLLWTRQDWLSLGLENVSSETFNSSVADAVESLTVSGFGLLISYEILQGFLNEPATRQALNGIETKNERSLLLQRLMQRWIRIKTTERLRQDLLSLQIKFIGTPRLEETKWNEILDSLRQEILKAQEGKLSDEKILHEVRFFFLTNALLSIKDENREPSSSGADVSIAASDLLSRIFTQDSVSRNLDADLLQLSQKFIEADPAQRAGLILNWEFSGDVLRTWQEMELTPLLIGNPRAGDIPAVLIDEAGYGILQQYAEKNLENPHALIRVKETADGWYRFQFGDLFSTTLHLSKSVSQQFTSEGLERNVHILNLESSDSGATDGFVHINLLADRDTLVIKLTRNNFDLLGQYAINTQGLGVNLTDYARSEMREHSFEREIGFIAELIAKAYSQKGKDYRQLNLSMQSLIKNEKPKMVKSFFFIPKEGWYVQLNLQNKSRFYKIQTNGTYESVTKEAFWARQILIPDNSQFEMFDSTINVGGATPFWRWRDYEQSLRMKRRLFINHRIEELMKIILSIAQKGESKEKMQPFIEEWTALNEESKKYESGAMGATLFDVSLLEENAAIFQKAKELAFAKIESMNAETELGKKLRRVKDAWNEYGIFIEEPGVDFSARLTNTFLALYQDEIIIHKKIWNRVKDQPEVLAELITRAILKGIESAETEDNFAVGNLFTSRGLQQIEEEVKREAVLKSKAPTLDLQRILDEISLEEKQLLTFAARQDPSTLFAPVFDLGWRDWNLFFDQMNQVVEREGQYHYLGLKGMLHEVEDNIRRRIRNEVKRNVYEKSLKTLGERLEFLVKYVIALLSRYKLNNDSWL